MVSVMVTGLDRHKHVVGSVDGRTIRVAKVAVVSKDPTYDIVRICRTPLLAVFI
jgi:hypothetical protein